MTKHQIKLDMTDMNQQHTLNYKRLTWDRHIVIKIHLTKTRGRVDTKRQLVDMDAIM